MDKEESNDDSELQIWRISFGIVCPTAVKCAIELGIADALHEHKGAMALEELTIILDCSSSHLRRLLRYLVYKGIIKEETIVRDGKHVIAYAPTAISRRLIRTGDDSMAAIVELETSPLMLNPWQFLSSRLRSNSASAFIRANGEDIWSLASHNPVHSHLVNDAMACITRVSMRALLDECVEVFDGVKTVVDVGGGYGVAMGMLVKACPWIKAINFDLPHVISVAPKIDGVHHIGGDMFAHVPEADAVFIKYVLHNWSDDECIQILKNCKEALSKDISLSRVIILEPVMEGKLCKDDGYEEIRLILDMVMLAHTSNGKERAEDEWKKVLHQAGFSNYTIKPTKSMNHVIVAYP